MKPPALLTMLLVVVAACASAGADRTAMATEQPTRRGTIKTTVKDCEIRGGEYVRHANPLPDDLVDCVLPAQIRRLGDNITYIAPRQVLASVYDYLYRAGAERPRYALYSYVVFPTPSRRAERFLEELFRTTSFVDVTSVSWEQLNVIYLPTRADKVASLQPIVADGSAPSAGFFITQVYDYGLAQRLLAQICAAPAEVIRDVCRSDLSRGPYLFTYASPASTLSPVPPPYLVLDLSSVHERAFGEFVAAYKEQVKREDYTDLQRIANLRLRLLNVVLTAADWMGPLRGAMADILHLADGEGGGNAPARPRAP